MTWNFHRYYNDSTDGLIGKLRLAEPRVAKLKGLRELVRNRTRDVFNEAKEVVKTSSANISLESITARVANTRLKYLSPQAQAEAAKLLRDMDDDAREAFLALTPRFWTQGSFQYDTLNFPYATPPQEMDIDDGTYLPMAIFEGRPIIGHQLLLLLVDSSLKSLVHENVGWQFEAKRTCARLKIPAEHTHIDVPMYAIPKDQFLLKEAALAKSRSTVFDSINGSLSLESADYELDEDCVNLALREGDQKWMKSDPKIVEDWFNDSCRRIGPHLRSVCRFMKSWRDVQWEKGGGPSSISLMAATVSILDRIAHDKNDLGATMRMLAKYLPDEFSKGVESPDHTDEKPLFSPRIEHGERELEIMERLSELHGILIDAQQCSSKELALQSINRAFGRRVLKSDLIVSEKSAPAFANEPKRGAQATTISTTMASG
ncbi:CBASS cGAMP synthase [Pseudomonas viridiflava]|uniref:CBASS cGAMP synthase n=1 Tax=Pseudomonas viridiflava TaxID=33069 RepID=UPI002B1E0E2F|nr:CBASS cGAMP synthase [Pseudomonas viridiflava]